MLLSYDDQAQIAEILFACGNPGLYTRFVSKMDKQAFETLSEWRALRKRVAAEQAASVRTGELLPNAPQA